MKCQLDICYLLLLVKWFVNVSQIIYSINVGQLGLWFIYGAQMIYDQLMLFRQVISVGYMVICNLCQLSFRIVVWMGIQFCLVVYQCQFKNVFVLLKQFISICQIVYMGSWVIECWLLDVWFIRIGQLFYYC